MPSFCRGDEVRSHKHHHFPYTNKQTYNTDEREKIHAYTHHAITTSHCMRFIYLKFAKFEMGQFIFIVVVVAVVVIVIVIFDVVVIVALSLLALPLPLLLLIVSCLLISISCN